MKSAKKEKISININHLIWLSICLATCIIKVLVAEEEPKLKFFSVFFAAFLFFLAVATFPIHFFRTRYTSACAFVTTKVIFASTQGLRSKSDDLLFLLLLAKNMVVGTRSNQRHKPHKIEANESGRSHSFFASTK